MRQLSDVGNVLKKHVQLATSMKLADGRQYIAAAVAFFRNSRGVINIRLDFLFRKTWSDFRATS